MNGDQASLSRYHVTHRQERKKFPVGASFNLTSSPAGLHQSTIGICSNHDYSRPFGHWRGHSCPPSDQLPPPTVSHPHPSSHDPSPRPHYHPRRSRNSSPSLKPATPRTPPRVPQTDTRVTPRESVSERSAQAASTSSRDALSTSSAGQNGSPARIAISAETTPFTPPRPGMSGTILTPRGIRAGSTLVFASRRRGSSRRLGMLLAGAS